MEVEAALRETLGNGGDGTANSEAALERWQAAFANLPASVKDRLTKSQ